MPSNPAAQSQADYRLERQLSADRAYGVFLDPAAVTAAGSTTSDATAITSLSGGLVIAAGADGTKGVRLPVPDRDGHFVRLKNNVNAILKVYPHSGAAINALSADAALSQAALTCADYCWDATTGKWFTMPLLPS